MNRQQFNILAKLKEDFAKASDLGLTFYSALFRNNIIDHNSITVHSVHAKNELDGYDTDSVEILGNTVLVVQLDNDVIETINNLPK